MRPVLYGDVSAAARRLYDAPAGRRAALCQRLLAEAEAADRHVRAHGRAHPAHGNGSLMSAARSRPLPPEPGFDDPEYCLCFAQVLRAVAALGAENWEFPARFLSQKSAPAAQPSTRVSRSA